MLHDTIWGSSVGNHFACDFLSCGRGKVAQVLQRIRICLGRFRGTFLTGSWPHCREYPVNNGNLVPHAPEDWCVDYGCCGKHGLRTQRADFRVCFTCAGCSSTYVHSHPCVYVDGSWYTLCVVFLAKKSTDSDLPRIQSCLKSWWTRALWACVASMILLDRCWNANHALTSCFRSPKQQTMV